jgi:hypothetical protein
VRILFEDVTRRRMKRAIGRLASQPGSRDLHRHVGIALELSVRVLRDRLSDWVFPPVSDAEPARVFDIAEQVLAFLAAIFAARKDAPAAAGKRLQRRLVPTA